MSSSTVRINELARQALRELAESSGEPMQVVLEKAIESYRRQRILEQTNKAFGLLRNNKKRWAEERKERSDWDKALRGGLEGDR